MADATQQIVLIRGTKPEVIEERIRLNIERFLIAAKTGIMPGGIKTSLPLFPEGEMSNFYEKYEDWATVPWSNMQMPAAPFGRSIAGPSPAPIIRIMHAISGLTDFLERSMSRLFSPTSDVDQVGRSLKSVKYGSVWLQYLMQDGVQTVWTSGKNIEEAMAIIRQVIDVFEYFRKPEIQARVRATHNKIWTEIDTFQDAHNGRKVSKGEPKPEYSMTSLWQEYVEHHWDFMEVQARAWIFKRLKILHEKFRAHFLGKLFSGRQVNATQFSATIDHQDMRVLTLLLDMYIDADFFVHRVIDGFKSTANVQHAVLADANTSEAECLHIYSYIETERQKGARAALQQIVDKVIRQREQGATIPTPPSMEEPYLIISREIAHKEMQPEIDNPPPLRMESWVADLTRPEKSTFGFVIYRISYSESDEAWEIFLKKLQDGIASGWEGIIGAADIRKKESFHWIDGRKEGIPQGDLNAARLHFKAFTKSPTFPKGLSKSTALGIPPNSVASVHDSKPNDRKGDLRGFIYAIDPSFDASKDTKAAKAGYNGTVKVIDQLVWTDLYVRATMFAAQRLIDYWWLAMQHPWGVYVGPTTAVKRRGWREMRVAMNVLLGRIQRLR